MLTLTDPLNCMMTVDMVRKTMIDFVEVLHITLDCYAKESNIVLILNIV